MKFYRTFWELQNWFCDPNQAFTSENWAKVTRAMDTVLSAFGVFSLADETQKSSKSKRQTPAKTAIIDDRINDYYFTKFLTSSKLISLQLGDPYFRRHILLQFLIFFQYISTNTTKQVQLLREKQVCVHVGQSYFLLTHAHRNL